jgi:hypothetical protein
MNIIVCPGIHAPGLTQSCLQDLQHELCQDELTNWLVFPTEDYPAYSPVHLLEFLHQHLDQPTPLIFLSYSAGVVAAIGTAWLWQRQGGIVKAVIALDGWGVPLGGDFPIHRLSHDYFTHWSSKLLGAGKDSFYADPEVQHLDLWGSPRTTWGWWETSHKRTYCTAAQVLVALIRRYRPAAQAL